jgi:cystathionine beta-lyase
VTTPLDRLGLDDLRKRTSIKWRQYAHDVLPLWVAEMDVTLAEPIAKALRDAVDRHDTGYPMPDTYVDAFAAFAAARWDWTVEPGSTAIVGDVMTGLVAVIRLVTQPGDAVVVNSPVYTPFYWFVTRADRRVVESPLTSEHRIDLDGLERVFAEHRPSAYLL